MIEPRQVATGTGWSVHRLGRMFCIQIGDTELWMGKQTDIARQSALRQITTTKPELTQPATEALQANWTTR